MDNDESASPTIGLDSVFITATTKAAEEGDVAVVDLPGAYLSTDMDNEEEVPMVLRAPLADLMALTTAKVNHKFATINTLGHKLLYVKLQQDLYGLLKSALLFYCKLWGNLHVKVFEINPYEPYVADKTNDRSVACGRSEDVSQVARSCHRHPQMAQRHIRQAPDIEREETWIPGHGPRLLHSRQGGLQHVHMKRHSRIPRGPWQNCQGPSGRIPIDRAGGQLQATAPRRTGSGLPSNSVSAPIPCNVIAMRRKDYPRLPHHKSQGPRQR